jgi:translation initiation factor 2 subunit 3
MLPPTLFELTVDIHLLERAVGTKELIEVDKIRKGETLLLDVGTTITVGTVVSLKGDAATLQLGRAVCAEEGFRTAISRKIVGRWRLIGYGIIK